MKKKYENRLEDLPDNGIDMGNLDPHLEIFDKITEVAKSTELGKEVMKEVAKTKTSFKVRDIKPNGEVQGTYEIPNLIRNEGESLMDFKIRCAELNSHTK